MGTEVTNTSCERQRKSRTQTFLVHGNTEEQCPVQCRVRMGGYRER